MADEISMANVARVELIPGELYFRWRATIGPADGRGLVAWGRTADGALEQLARDCHRHGWIFDDTWHERPAAQPSGPPGGPSIPASNASPSAASDARKSL